jgi:hypothetical protein
VNAGFLEGVDWGRPWLAHLRGTAERVLQAEDWRDAINAFAAQAELRNHRGLPVRFVPQASLPPETPYEAFISATGNVPTRDNLHDFFNALVWLNFPTIKVQLNALQAREIANQGARICARRGATRDAATIFDENAALLVVHDRSLLEALREHRWRESFLVHRQEFEHGCEVWLFGHALMEKLVTPFKAITAHAWPLITDRAFFELSLSDKRVWLDATIADQLREGLNTADFSPLPVLGIPGWCGGQDEAFYADTAVFRPKRLRR